MNILLVPLIIVSVIINPINCKSNCNDECLTKTYCLSSSDSSTSCYVNNLAKAKWSASLSSNYDLVTLTLSADNVQPSEIRTISLVFKPSTYSTSQTNYTCFKLAAGVTASVTQTARSSTQVIQGGITSYSKNVLTCTWSFTMVDATWPLYYDGVAQLMSDKSGILELKSGEKSAIVANNVADLPSYQFQYLKCCNKVHGNNVYLTIFNQTNDNNYLMKIAGKNPKSLTLSLTNSNGMQLIFNCSFDPQRIDGFVVNKTGSTSITDLLYKKYVYGFNLNPICYWSHPLLLTGPFGKMDTTDGVFDMQLKSDGTVVYTEKGVKLKNSAPKLLSLTSTIFMIISLLLHLS